MRRERKRREREARRKEGRRGGKREEENVREKEAVLVRNDPEKGRKEAESKNRERTEQDKGEERLRMIE